MAYTTIDDPSAYFQIALWTGNGGTLAVTNDGNSDLQPDLLWLKSRSGATTANHLVDTTRGEGTGSDDTPNVSSDSSDAEYDRDILSSTGITSDGFSLDGYSDTNANTATHVGWQWKANGGSRTTNAEDGNNPAGGYQANATAGFSIVDYTGTGAAGTMAHGLSKAPEWIYIKRRSGADSWRLYHKDIGLNGSYPNFMQPDLTTAVNSGDSGNFTAAPSATLFSIGDYSVVNSDDETYIAYCFHSVQGYSKFGSYTGNGDADGTFVYTGFKPAWILVKRTDNTNGWFLMDNKRSPFNLTNDYLRPNATDAEGEAANSVWDTLSNGFKLRGSGADVNASGSPFIYMAFAESPFVTSGGVPCTAR